MTLDEVHSGDSESKEPTANRILLALFDVLGFSERIQQQNLDSILSTYRDLIEKAVLEPARSCLGAVLTPEGGRVLTVFRLPVRYAYFSDTILLWVPLEQVYAAAFVTRCADLMCEAIAMAIPLRGAICLGEAVMHRATNVYLGKPLVEAARLEKGQDWVGLTFGWSATWPQFIAELEGPSMIEYPAPMKPGYADAASPVVVDWPRAWRDKHSACLKERLTILNTNPNPRVRSKYENTITFVDHSIACHDWHKHPDKIPADAKLRMVPFSRIRSP